MTSIERNFNGTVYRVSLKEEEMTIGGSPTTILSLELMVDQDRGVLLQRWQEEGEGAAQVVNKQN